MPRNFSLQPERNSRMTGVPLNIKARTSSIGSQEQRPLYRDVKSKANMTKMIGSLIQFLETTDYSNSLSPKILHSPNSKEIFSIFEHLVRQICPTFRIEHDGMKAEEVCLNTLKMLGYSNILSKHHLLAPGAPQAWNSVLAAFDWLREEIENANDFINFSVFRHDDDQDVEEEPLNKIIFELKSVIFKRRREGSDVSSNEIEDYRCRINKVLDAPSEDDMKKLYDRRNVVDKELDSLVNLDGEERSLRSQLTEMESLLKSLDGKLHDHESQIAQFKSLDEENTKVLKEIDVEIKDSEQKLASVRAKVKEQEDAGYGRLAQEYFMLRERVDARLNAKDDLIKQVEQKELEYTRREGVIAPTLDAYNHLVGSLRKPQFSEIAKNCGLEVCTYCKGFNMAKQIPTLVNRVRACVEQLTVALTTKEQRVNELTERMETLQAAIDNTELPDVQAKLNEVKAELSKLDELLAEEDNAHAKAEQEYVNVSAQRANELDQLKKQMAAEENHQIELTEKLEERIKERMRVNSYIETINQQLSVFIPYIESYFKTKESANRVWQMHVNLLRDEAQSAAQRIENKVKRALEEYSLSE
ncbi:Kinetochore protein NDC80 isoform 1 [Schistosoma japonicum]|uniref:Kinetochore protein NDC80 n=1 Tax=Schistosoma japonicum TaxID=6182 RepID=A0A4Z2DHV1_SCHJA|nr:kinetochore protein NDC80 [Schistosoma japonicum]KAH8873972.1 kinetochore protein NDC80 [Schistosoma japonicum]KAH8873973.1 kinetochore protein NDC80 [Schistosoma japonicum]TNN15789.1 Kinetochore protein NDC80 isoform 1 [Schistosoma japonicum]TNN15790.1 Kinetochore protein NDC80 isoform 1 [Schistosoma japonicum]